MSLVSTSLRRAIPMTIPTISARQRRYAVSLGGESHMGTLTFDLRHSLRALVKSPVFTAVTVMTLAPGIGANSANLGSRVSTPGSECGERPDVPACGRSGRAVSLAACYLPARRAAIVDPM